MKVESVTFASKSPSSCTLHASGRMMSVHSLPGWKLRSQGMPASSRPSTLAVRAFPSWLFTVPRSVLAVPMKLAENSLVGW